MATRIDAVAAKVREFLRTPREEFHRRAGAEETILPHVECLYYHTQQGAKHLAYYHQLHGTALHFHGNACPCGV